MVNGHWISGMLSSLTIPALLGGRQGLCVCLVAVSFVKLIILKYCRSHKKLKK